MPGPPPKPTLIKQGEGDRAKIGRAKLDAKVASEPQPPRGFPECPKHLKGDARYAWGFLTGQLAEMQLDFAVDALALEMACVAFATYRKAQRTIDTGGKGGGMFTTAKTGWTQQAAGVAIAANARKEFLAFCSHFGFTPAARARIAVDGAGGDSELARIEEALSKPRQRLA
jgi:P27 family predicted phage terminase small subunit